MPDLTRRGLVALLAAASAAPALAARGRPLPSWTESPRRRAILDFVARITTPGAGFVPVEQRIATFDNDGALWCEQPIYTEAAFMADRMRALVEANPELRGQQPYKAVVQRDLATLAKTPQADLLKMIDDKGGKPVNINLHIGRRPILSFGNSDGDLEMLQYCTTGDGPRLGLLVHHDDAAREYAYDRASPIGRLDKALDEAPRRGWQVVSMKDDWSRIFPFEPARES